MLACSGVAYVILIVWPVYKDNNDIIGCTSIEWFMNIVPCLCHVHLHIKISIEIIIIFEYLILLTFN